jgi:hypothetical protein
MAWGTTTLQPVYLARPLLLATGMQSWHDRAAQGFGTTPPALRRHASDAVMVGSPILRPPGSEEPGGRVSVSP